MVVRTFGFCTISVVDVSVVLLTAAIMQENKAHEPLGFSFTTNDLSFASHLQNVNYIHIIPLHFTL